MLQVPTHFVLVTLPRLGFFCTEPTCAGFNVYLTLSILNVSELKLLAFSFPPGWYFQQAQLLSSLAIYSMPPQFGIPLTTIRSLETLLSAISKKLSPMSNPHRINYHKLMLLSLGRNWLLLYCCNKWLFLVQVASFIQSITQC